LRRPRGVPEEEAANEIREPGYAGAAAAAGAQALRPPCANGCPYATPAQDLYTGELQGTALHTCCDPYFGCRQYPSNRRSEYWPFFAHPRWLPCDALYDTIEDRRRSPSDD